MFLKIQNNKKTCEGNYCIFQESILFVEMKISKTMNLLGRHVAKASVPNHTIFWVCIKQNKTKQKVR
jgi:hypothetical protein